MHADLPVESAGVEGVVMSSAGVVMSSTGVPTQTWKTALHPPNTFSLYRSTLNVTPTAHSTAEICSTSLTLMMGSGLPSESRNVFFTGSIERLISLTFSHCWRLFVGTNVRNKFRGISGYS